VAYFFCKVFITYHGKRALIMHYRTSRNLKKRELFLFTISGTAAPKKKGDGNQSTP